MLWILLIEIPLLTDITIILGAAVFVIYLFQRLNLPTILGYLITGILVGPYVLKLIQVSHEVDVLAEIGIILLLFIIGMEFSLKSLAAIKNTVLVGGSVQVGLTILFTAVVTYFSGFSVNQSIFLGFLFSLSSTAIVLKTLQERSEVNSPQGKTALAILIFQDIIVVPMMLLAPILGGGSGNVWMELLTLFLKAAAVILVILYGARYLIPLLLHEVAKTRSRELFILSIVVICFAVAWGTSIMGLSLALGAFLAGLVISESEYSHQATGLIIPFREIFTSFFFVSIGMLLDIFFLFDHLFLILGLLILVSIAKLLIAGGAALALKYPMRTALLTGLSLFQVGEFAFILSKVGIDNNLLTEDIYQYFLAVSILSMGITPFVIQHAHRIAGIFLKATPHEKVSTKKAEEEEFTESLNDHTIIIGYGVNGRNVAKAAKFANIPYVIVEMNARTVQTEKAKGEPIIYGDASNPFIIEHVKVFKARVAIIAISDPTATKAIVTSIRSICPTVHVIVRTRYMSEMTQHLELGASEVIPEEFETSVEIFTRLLHKYLVPQDEIVGFVQNIRSDSYEMLRPYEISSKKIAEISIPEMNISTLKVQSRNKEVIGKTMAESHIRSRFGINVLAIKRNEQHITHIEADTTIEPEDILYLAGKPENIAQFNESISL
jgi:CPA2 family monovalent cation:H+ antiporter-2